jgi:two-component system, NarL family, response regulator LiaR
MTSTAFASESRLAFDAQDSPQPSPVSASRAQTESGRGVTRVLIANHQPIVRHGLRALLALESDLEVIGETDDGSEAVRLARRLRPNVVLIDLSIPTVGGIAATRIIRAELADTQVIVMTGANEDAAAIESIRAGAVAYLPRNVRIEELLWSLRRASDGQVILPARAAARIVQSMGRNEALSRRETDVLYLVARGLANKQVARELGITQSTVKCHVSGILGKLGLPSRTQIALYAARTGLVALEQRAEGI